MKFERGDKVTIVDGDEDGNALFLDRGEEVPSRRLNVGDTITVHATTPDGCLVARNGGFVHQSYVVAVEDPIDYELEPRPGVFVVAHATYEGKATVHIERAGNRVYVFDETFDTQTEAADAASSIATGIAEVLND